MSLFKKLLDWFNGVDEDGFPLNGDCPCCQDEPECKCCPIALEDNDCVCKEEQVIEFQDGTVEKYWTRLECSDWNCSRCH